MINSEYIEFGEHLAAKAGEIMQSERDSRLHIQRKPDKTLVTQVDLAIQDLAIDEIIHTFPGHAVIGEERSYGPSDAVHVWRIDPLDGTGEYIEGTDSGLPTYGFGLAKQYRSTLEAGLFFNPSRDEMYVAAKGLGSYLNNERIRVNQAAFAPGVAYDFTHWQSRLGDAHVFEEVLGPALNYYSAIYQGCTVALGRSAFSVFLGDTAHDIAPAAIIVEEAGGKVSDVYGEPHNWRGEMLGAIFSNRITHTRVLEALSR